MIGNSGKLPDVNATGADTSNLKLASSHQQAKQLGVSPKIGGDKSYLMLDQMVATAQSNLLGSRKGDKHMPPGQLSRKNLTVSGHGANHSCNNNTVGGVTGKSNSHMVGGGQTS